MECMSVAMRMGEGWLQFQLGDTGRRWTPKLQLCSTPMHQLPHLYMDHIIKPEVGCVRLSQKTREYASFCILLYLLF